MQRDGKATHCPSTRPQVVMITRRGRTALYCYSVVMVVMDCIPFIKWAEMVAECRLEKKATICKAKPGCTQLGKVRPFLCPSDLEDPFAM